MSQRSAMRNQLVVFDLAKSLRLLRMNHFTELKHPRNGKEVRIDLTQLQAHLDAINTQVGSLIAQRCHNARRQINLQAS